MSIPSISGIGQIALTVSDLGAAKTHNPYDPLARRLRPWPCWYSAACVIVRRLGLDLKMGVSTFETITGIA
jgi:hypothetical protein